MSSLSEQDILNIINDFDFERVLKVMTVLNWKYGNTIITIGVLRNTAFELLNSAIELYDKQSDEGKKYGVFCATGGFEARVETFMNGRAALSLSFLVESVS